MVSAAPSLRAPQERAVTSRPYTQMMVERVGILSLGLRPPEHLRQKTRRSRGHSALGPLEEKTSCWWFVPLRGPRAFAWRLQPNITKAALRLSVEQQGKGV